MFTVEAHYQFGFETILVITRVFTGIATALDNGQITTIHCFFNGFVLENG
jgi:hypothetical protein